MIAGFKLWIEVDGEKITAIEEIVQVLHNASLLIDEHMALADTGL